MRAKQFYDWQTGGGTNDVMRLVDCLERSDIAWCAVGDVAVNHWAAEAIERAVSLLEEAGFGAERFEWSVNFKGSSRLSIQLSTEAFYREFPSRAVAADVNGILLRVACLEDTLAGKMRAWSDSTRRQSKRIKDLGDIAWLVEAHPRLWDLLTGALKEQVQRPGERQTN